MNKRTFAYGASVAVLSGALSFGMHYAWMRYEMKRFPYSKGMTP